jgi:hypothetical protein
MGSFVAYTTIKPSELRKIAKKSIIGIKKWFKYNPGRKECHAELWYGICLDITRTANVAEIINRILKETLEKDAKFKKEKAIKKPAHKYKIGDVVGVCSNCMAEFEIKGFEKNGYKAKCLLLHLSNPEQSSIKIGQVYFVKESQIVLKLR